MHIVILCEKRKNDVFYYDDFNLAVKKFKGLRHGHDDTYYNIYGFDFIGDNRYIISHNHSNFNYEHLETLIGLKNINIRKLIRDYNIKKILE